MGRSGLLEKDDAEAIFREPVPNASRIAVVWTLHLVVVALDWLAGSLSRY